MNMNKFFFIAVLITFSISTNADVFDDLEKETSLITKYCAEGTGRVSEEIMTNRNKKTGEIISEQTVTVIYCTDGSRHVAKNTNNDNKLSIDTTKILDGVNQKSITKEYTCTFAISFLIGKCNGKQYFYDEKSSSVKIKDLARFYQFVKKNRGGTTDISDTCIDFKSKNRKLIKCNDFGITLETDDTYISEYPY